MTDVHPLRIDDLALFRACENAKSWLRGLRSFDGPDLAGVNYNIPPRDDPSVTPAPAEREAALARLLASDDGVGAGCSLKGKPAPGDDYQVKVSDPNGNVSVFGLEPWQSLPYYIRIAQISSRSSTLILGAVNTRYFGDTIRSGLAQERAIAKLIPGFTYFGGSWDPGATDVPDSVAFELRSGGKGYIRWKDGASEPMSYSIRNGGGLCFRLLKPGAAVECGYYRTDEFNEAVWMFPERKLGPIRLAFASDASFRAYLRRSAFPFCRSSGPAVDGWPASGGGVSNQRLRSCGGSTARHDCALMNGWFAIRSGELDEGGIDRRSNLAGRIAYLSVARSTAAGGGLRS